MFKPLKWLVMVGKFQDVSKAYKEETGKDRPKYLSRRFIAAVILLVGTGVGLLFGIKIPQETLNLIIENIDKIITASIMLYALIEGIVGVVGAKKRKKK